MLSRNLQKKLLEGYAENYPELCGEDWIYDGWSKDEVKANAYYLWQHDLIEAKWVFFQDGGYDSGPIRISAKGMDFLADDGGLSAILGTITVKLHDDTIRALIIERVEKAEADPGTKAQIVAAIKALPADGLKLLAEKAMGAGLEHLPAAIQPLREWLGL